MIRTLVRSALVAALVTAGSWLVPAPAGADHSCLTGKTGPACKNPQQTGANANNPRGGGVPASGRNGPVCGNGRHVGNPHCRPAGVRVEDKKVTKKARVAGTKVQARVAGTKVRASAARTTPRAHKAVAPHRGTAVSTRAGKAL